MFGYLVMACFLMLLCPGSWVILEVPRGRHFGSSRAVEPSSVRNALGQVLLEELERR
jgi:hypothetical protein